MEKSSTSIFKIRAADWGIYIDIIGQTIHGKLGNKVSNHLFYEYLDNKTRLTEREQQLLLHGLK